MLRSTSYVRVGVGAGIHASLYLLHPCSRRLGHPALLYLLHPCSREHRSSSITLLTLIHDLMRYPNVHIANMDAGT